MQPDDAHARADRVHRVVLALRHQRVAARDQALQVAWREARAPERRVEQFGRRDARARQEAADEAGGALDIVLVLRRLVQRADDGHDVMALELRQQRIEQRRVALRHLLHRGQGEDRDAEQLAATRQQLVGQREVGRDEAFGEVGDARHAAEPGLGDHLEGDVVAHGEGSEARDGGGGACVEPGEVGLDARDADVVDVQRHTLLRGLRHPGHPGREGVRDAEHAAAEDDPVRAQRQHLRPLAEGAGQLRHAAAGPGAVHREGMRLGRREGLHRLDQAELVAEVAVAIGAEEGGAPCHRSSTGSRASSRSRPSGVAARRPSACQAR
jgi:hypothetical protein